MHVVKETKHFLDLSMINDSDTDILTFFQDHDAEITKALEQSLLRFGKIKVNFMMQIILSKFTPRHEVVIEKPKNKPKWASRLLSAVKAAPKVLKLLSQYVTSKLKTYSKQKQRQILPLTTILTEVTTIRIQFMLRCLFKQMLMMV